MRLSLPFTAPLFGIQCTGGVLRVALVRRAWWKESMIKVWEKEISPKTIAGDGVIVNPQECAELIRENLLKRKIPLKGSVAFLLPPEKVYTHLFTLQGEKENIDRLLKAEVAKIIPEEETDLMTLSAIVSETDNRMTVAFAAVRSDVLQGYSDLAHALGLTLDRATTPSAAIACSTKADHAAKTFIFLSLPSGKEEKNGTLTMFHQHWPVDETPLPVGCTEAQAIALTRELAQEYTELGFPPERLVLWADPQLEEQLKAEASRSAGYLPLPEIERALPWLQDRNIVWGAIQSACLVPRGRLSINFTSPEQRAFQVKKWIKVGVAAVTVLIAAGLVLRIIASLV